MKRLLITLALISVAAVGSFYWYKKISAPAPPLFTTTRPEVRDIKQTIHASGELEIKGNIKVGSLVSGTIEKILVEENQHVSAGQLLAVIDNGKRDSQVIEARGILQRAQAELDYLHAFWGRQKKLFDAGQISRDAWEQVVRDLKRAQGGVTTAQGILLNREIEYGNTRILAPADGIVTNVGISLGERVTTDLDATVLFEIGQDITKMQGQLRVDESDIGQIKVGQDVEFTVDTYMDRPFHATVTQIAYSPTVRRGNKYYQASIDVDNSGLQLRPGMSLQAQINVAKVKSSLAVTHQVFSFTTTMMRALAEKITYQIHPLLPERKRQFADAHGSQFQTKYVWIVKDNAFHERALRIDITDDIYFEVTDGLAPDDEIIIDIEEDDAMRDVYKKWFKGAL